MASGLIRGRTPVRVRKARQNDSLELSSPLREGLDALGGETGALADHRVTGSPLPRVFKGRPS